jgi:hypothetical protein
MLSPARVGPGRRRHLGRLFDRFDVDAQASAQGLALAEVDFRRRDRGARAEPAAFGDARGIAAAGS